MPKQRKSTTEAKEKKFAQLWTSNGNNAAEAYRGIAQKEITANTANVEGSKYLSRPNVKKYIKAIQKRTSIKLNITRETLVSELQELKERNRFDDDKLVVEAMREQAKLLGLYAPEKTQNININKSLTDEEEAAIEAIENEYGGKES